MVYSYTEKRICKDFGKRPQVLDIPSFLSNLTRSRSLSSKIQMARMGWKQLSVLCFQLSATAVMLNYNMSAIV